jgi:hypothetical protein
MTKCYKCGETAANIMTVGDFQIWLCGDCKAGLSIKCVEAAIAFLNKPSPLIADLSGVYGSPQFKEKNKKKGE